MKNLLFLFLLNCCFLNSTFAQVSLRLAGGLNSSNYQYSGFDELPPLSPKTGYFIEVAPVFKISEKLKVVVNGQYSLKGYKRDQDTPIIQATRFGYIDLIPELEYRIIKFLDIGIGVNYGFKIKEEHKLEPGGWEESNIGIDNVKSSDYGISAKVKLNFNKFFGYVRYNIGFKNVTDLNFIDGNGVAISDVEQNSRNLQIGLGYKFML